MSRLKKYTFFIGLLLLMIVLWKSDLPNLFKVISNINWWWVLIAYLIGFPEVLSKAFRWQLIMKKQAIKYSLKDSFFMYFSGLAAGFFTPGKLGDLTRALYLKKDGHSTGKSLVSVVLDRLAAMSYLLVAGYVGALFLLNSFWQQTYIVLLVLVVTLIILIPIFKKRYHIKIFKKVFTFLTPPKYQSGLELTYHDFILDLKKHSALDFVKYFLLTIIPWVIYYFEFYFLAKAVGIADVPFVYLSVAITVSFFLTFLPISYLGVGTREAALLVFLLPFGVSREVVIVLAELALLDSLWTAGTGLVFWRIKPIPFEAIGKKQLTINKA